MAEQTGTEAAGGILPQDMATPRRGGWTRRRFLAGAGLGLLAGAPLGWLALKGWRYFDGSWHSPFTGQSHEVSRPAFAMPGPFPGRVIEVRHPGAVDAAGAVNA